MSKRRVKQHQEDLERLRSLAAPLSEGVDEPDSYEEIAEFKLNDLLNLAYGAVTIGNAAVLDAVSKIPNLFEKELPKLFDNGAQIFKYQRDSLFQLDYSTGLSHRKMQSSVQPTDWDEAVGEMFPSLSQYVKVLPQGDGSFRLWIPVTTNSSDKGHIPAADLKSLLRTFMSNSSRMNDGLPHDDFVNNAMMYLEPDDRARIGQKLRELMVKQMALVQKALTPFVVNPEALEDLSQRLVLRVPMTFDVANNSEFISQDLILGDNDFAYDKGDLKKMLKGTYFIVEMSGIAHVNMDRAYSPAEFQRNGMPFVRRQGLAEGSFMYQPITSQADLDKQRMFALTDLREDNSSSAAMDYILPLYAKEQPPIWLALIDQFGNKDYEIRHARWERFNRDPESGDITGQDEEPQRPETKDVDGWMPYILRGARTRLDIANFLISLKAPLPKAYQKKVVISDEDYADAQARLQQQAFTARWNAANKDRKQVDALAHVEITLPAEVAQYVTQSQNPRGIDVLQWIQAHVENEYVGGKDDTTFFRGIDLAIQDTRQLPQRPRTNADGMIIGPDADVIFVPDPNQATVDRYLQTIQNASQGAYKEGALAFNEVGLAGMRVIANDEHDVHIKTSFVTGEDLDGVAAAARSIASRYLGSTYIYTDWGADSLVYTTRSGNVNILDVAPYAPATPADYMKVLNKQYGDVNKDLSTALRMVIQAWFTAKDKSLTSYYQPEDFAVPPELRDRIGDDFREFFNISANVSLGDYLKAMGVIGERMVSHNVQTDYPFDILKEFKFRDLSSTSEVPLLRPIGRILDEIEGAGMQAVWDIVGDPNQAGADATAVTTRMSGVALAYLIGRWGGTQDYPALKSMVEEKQQAYSKTPLKVNDDTALKPIPFIKSDMSVLQHQIRVLAEGQRGPDKMVSHVDAGGGKTIMNILDCLNVMHTAFQNNGIGRQKRPLMMCPKSLIKNYIEDLTYVTEGQINPVVLSTEVINRYGHDYMYNLIYNAPVNTIVLCDFDFPKNGSYGLQYGSQNLQLSNNGELMRRFEWIYLSMDESQYLANLDSQRSQAVRAQATLTPTLRETTGTYVHGMLTDAAGQFSIMSPSTFGSKDDFILKYAQEIYRGKPVSWKPEAERLVRKEMDDASNYVRVSRKEWAALLPKATETFYPVELTRAQRGVYQSILEEALEAIMSDPELMKKLKAADEDEENVANIEMLLRPYLQRLEMFISAPAHDQMGDKVLTGADRISPKSAQVNELFKEHMADKDNGKVLIFCAYVASAEALHAALPEDLQKKVILYYAADKDKLIPRFQKDDNIVGMIGVETSLNTGHNFQFVNRLISIDSVWSPGEFEQGQSRLNRPDPKNAYGERKRIYFDRIIADGTIDVTKTARMMSKLLTMVRYQASDDRYDKLPNLPLVSMTLDSILADNRFGNADQAGSLFHYISAYHQYTQIRAQEYKEFMQTYDGPTKPRQLESAGHLPGSALIQVPYTSNMQLPFQDQLGILPISDYMADKDLVPDEADLKGLAVHTEYGDGVVTVSGKSTIKVKLNDGSGTVSVNKLAIFVILNPKDKTPIRARLAKLVGMKQQATQYAPDDVKAPVVPVTPEAPVTEPEDDEEDEPAPEPSPKVEVPAPKKVKPVVTTEMDGKVTLMASILNNMIFLGLDRDDPDMTDEMAQKLGFRPSGDMIFATIPTYRAMDRVIEALTANFEIQPRYLADLKTAQEAFHQGKRRLLNFEAALDSDIRNFYLDRKRAVPKGELRPYISFYDGECMIMLDISKQPSALQVPRKVRVPTVQWDKLDGGGEWYMLLNTKAEVKAEIKAIRATGVEIENYDEVVDMINSITLRKKTNTVPAAKVNRKEQGTTLRRFQTRSGKRYVALVKNVDGTYSLDTDTGKTDLGKVSESVANRQLTKWLKNPPGGFKYTEVVQ